MASDSCISGTSNGHPSGPHFSYPSAEEQAELLRRAQAGDEQARWEVVLRNDGLAWTVAKRYLEGGLELEELVTMARLGLYRAAGTWDPDYGVPFGSFAPDWSERLIKRELDKQRGAVGLPDGAWSLWRRIQKLQREARRTRGYPLRTEELFQRIRRTTSSDISLRRVRQLMQWTPRSVSLEAPVGDADSSTLAEMMGAPASWHEGERARELKQAAQELLSHIQDARDRCVLELCLGLRGCRPHNLKEVGAMFDVGRERIRQLRNRALETIREQVDLEGMEDRIEDVFETRERRQQRMERLASEDPLPAAS